jgi:PAS domain S-box-containing protein
MDSPEVAVSVLEFMPDAVLLVSPDGRITFVNRTGEALFGYDRTELVGQPVEVLIPAPLRDAHRTERSGYVAAPRVRPMGLGLELRALAKDGREIAVEISLAPFRVGAQTLTIAAVRDVAERKLLEEGARRAKEAEEEVRQRDEVLAIASHELRGPVGIVQLQVSRLERAAAETIRDLTAMRERMQKVERNARHLGRLVEDLLDVRQGHTQVLRLEELDLSELTRDTVDRLREELERMGAHVTLHAPRPVPGRWDQLRIEQVITNIVVNAAKYGQGKPIAVSVEGDDALARVLVVDQGIGIATEDQARIFEKFERAPPTAELVRGLGLGLYIARQIVQSHGGRILLRSSTGSGSTFTVELPRATAQGG